MDHFLPALTTWFETTLGRPSAVQERAWATIRSGAHTLIAAPTGSGKTLAAFLNALDVLLRQGDALRDETQVVYVSPLRALSHDVQKNLQVPLAGIRALDPTLPEVRALVRTGDTKASERTAMGKKPPHVLVTTPESLYVLLTSAAGRKMLATTKTVIVDEIHAVLRDKRGSHLGLSLERLEALAGPFQRIGLSATQRPIETVARFLVGAGRACEIVDVGHRRTLDLGLLLPKTPLGTVCSTELWEEIYDGIVAAIQPERTTLVFTNTRKMAERVAARLTERLGKERVTSHHGSLSKAHRLDAETRLKEGRLKALVATASLELGIDIGDVDLVVQIGVPGTIAAFLQRIGRAGHGPGRVPKGRLVPLTTDELVVSAALLRCVNAGELDQQQLPEAPLDVLAQQIVAEVAARGEEGEDALFARFTRAWSYRTLAREDFDAVLAMHAEGRLALLHRNASEGRVRATKRARIPALTAGGAIPDIASYDVVLEPDGVRIGTVEEDFAVESSIGDVFQLGNASWRVVRMEKGTLRVADAQGAPPSLPFWFGEGLARSKELAAAVSRLREDACAEDFVARGELPREAALQIQEQCRAGRATLGVVPTQERVVLERFLDEGGGSQLVLHGPFGSRINRALGLALRKRFCRGFGFELQAAANEDAVLLSLGPMHEFPLQEVFSYLHPNTARDVLVQALLRAPMFETRWRWNVVRSLLLPRTQGGRRLPPFLVRMRADDLLAGAFPAVQACAENLPGGDLEVPWRHPIVRQTILDCLHEAMDVDGMLAVLRGLRQGTIAGIARETTTPSAFANGILHAMPYQFLDGGELQERRSQAAPRARVESTLAADGTEVVELDADAVEHVREETRIVPEDAEELHEALLWCGWLTDSECEPFAAFVAELERAGRVTRRDDRVFAAEAPADEKACWRGRLEWVGPVFEAAPELDELVREGKAQPVRVAGRLGVCNRRLVQRIVRRSRDARRVNVPPASSAEYLRFLAAWQHVVPEHRLDGPAGVLEVLRQLAGCEVPAAEWERSVLPARVHGYRREWLDQLVFQGEVAWCRLSGSARVPLKRAPLALLPRERLPTWLALHAAPVPEQLGSAAAQIEEVLRARGPLFQREIKLHANLLQTWFEEGVLELVARGLVTCDSFHALRQLLVPAGRRKVPLDPPGRFSLVRPPGPTPPASPTRDDENAEFVARQYLDRYGIVVRRALQKEPTLVPWRSVLRALRVMELRGEVHGGRFVAGWDGEQYALPRAIEVLRTLRGRPTTVAITVAAADPLNLEGLLTSGPRVSRQSRARITL